MIAFSHRNAMSFMHPRTLRSAVFVTMTFSGSRSVNVLDGRPSLRSSRPMTRARRHHSRPRRLGWRQRLGPASLVTEPNLQALSGSDVRHRGRYARSPGPQNC